MPTEPPTVKIGKLEAEAMRLAALQASKLTDEELARFDIYLATQWHLNALRARPAEERK